MILLNMMPCCCMYWNNREMCLNLVSLPRCLLSCSSMYIFSKQCCLRWCCVIGWITAFKHQLLETQSMNCYLFLQWLCRMPPNLYFFYRSYIGHRKEMKITAEDMICFLWQSAYTLWVVLKLNVRHSSRCAVSTC